MVNDNEYVVKNKRVLSEKGKQVKEFEQQAREDYFKEHGRYPEEDRIVIAVRI